MKKLDAKTEARIEEIIRTLTLEQKLEAFLSLSLRGYCVPEDELQKVLQFIAGMDIRAISEKVMQDLFQALAMRYDFTLPETV